MDLVAIGTNAGVVTVLHNNQAGASTTAAFTLPGPYLLAWGPFGRQLGVSSHSTKCFHLLDVDHAVTELRKFAWADATSRYALSCERPIALAAAAVRVAPLSAVEAEQWRPKVNVLPRQNLLERMLTEWMSGVVSVFCSIDAHGQLSLIVGGITEVTSAKLLPPGLTASSAVFSAEGSFVILEVAGSAAPLVFDLTPLLIGACERELLRRLVVWELREFVVDVATRAHQLWSDTVRTAMSKVGSEWMFRTTGDGLRPRHDVIFDPLSAGSTQAEFNGTLEQMQATSTAALDLLQYHSMPLLAFDVTSSDDDAESASDLYYALQVLADDIANSRDTLVGILHWKAASVGASKGSPSFPLEDLLAVVQRCKFLDADSIVAPCQLGRFRFHPPRVSSVASPAVALSESAGDATTDSVPWKKGLVLRSGAVFVMKAPPSSITAACSIDEEFVWTEGSSDLRVSFGPDFVASESLPLKGFKVDGENVCLDVSVPRRMCVVASRRQLAVIDLDASEDDD